MDTENMTEELEVGEFDMAPPCKNNLYVGCDDKTKCEKCGWNRKVSVDRIVWNFGKKFVGALSE